MTVNSKLNLGESTTVRQRHATPHVHRQPFWSPVNHSDRPSTLLCLWRLRPTAVTRDDHTASYTTKGHVDRTRLKACSQFLRLIDLFYSPFPLRGGSEGGWMNREKNLSAARARSCWGVAGARDWAWLRWNRGGEIDKAALLIVFALALKTLFLVRGFGTACGVPRKWRHRGPPPRGRSGQGEQLVSLCRQPTVSRTFEISMICILWPESCMTSTKWEQMNG